MKSDPNYPDDIRQYDHDPRSPFYKGDVTEEAAQDAQDALDAAGDAAYDRKRDQELEEEWESCH